MNFTRVSTRPDNRARVPSQAGTVLEDVPPAPVFGAPTGTLVTCSPSTRGFGFEELSVLLLPLPLLLLFPPLLLPPLRLPVLPLLPPPPPPEPEPERASIATSQLTVLVAFEAVSLYVLSDGTTTSTEPEAASEPTPLSMLTLDAPVVFHLSNTRAFSRTTVAFASSEQVSGPVATGTGEFVNLQVTSSPASNIMVADVPEATLLLIPFSLQTTLVKFQSTGTSSVT